MALDGDSVGCSGAKNRCVGSTGTGVRDPEQGLPGVCRPLHSFLRDLCLWWTRAAAAGAAAGWKRRQGRHSTAELCRGYSKRSEQSVTNKGLSPTSHVSLCLIPFCACLLTTPGSSSVINSTDHLSCSYLLAAYQENRQGNPEQSCCCDWPHLALHGVTKVPRQTQLVREALF